MNAIVTTLYVVRDIPVENEYYTWSPSEAFNFVNGKNVCEVFVHDEGYVWIIKYINENYDKVSDARKHQFDMLKQQILFYEQEYLMQKTEQMHMLLGTEEMRTILGMEQIDYFTQDAVSNSEDTKTYLNALVEKLNSIPFTDLRVIEVNRICRRDH